VALVPGAPSGLLLKNISTVIDRFLEPRVYL
jgi:hypothetical protein